VEVLEECKRRRRAHGHRPPGRRSEGGWYGSSNPSSRANAAFPFPEDPTAQLMGGDRAVFQERRTRRAVDYRRVHGIPTIWVPRSAWWRWCRQHGGRFRDGGAFTRDAARVRRAHGDVLTTRARTSSRGARTPDRSRSVSAASSQGVPRARAHREKLERHFQGRENIEFTFGRQAVHAADAPRSARWARAVRTAVEMVEEGLIHVQ